MLLIGIIGGTASGKTTLVNDLQKHYSDKRLLVISQDSYYKSNEHLTLTEREKINFDHPDAIDFDLLYKHLIKLRSNKTINIPSYSFITHNRTNETTKASPKEIIIVEGILLFNDKRLVNLFDLKIFIDADADERLIRRVKRDSEERGRNFEEVSNRYLTTLKPMHLKFIEPGKRNADIILENNNDSKNQLIKLIQCIENHL